MKTKRNDPCPCGSGKKYKHCHGSNSSSPSFLTSRSEKNLEPAGEHFDKPRQVQSRETLRGCSGCTACCGPALLINDPQLISPPGQSCPHLSDDGCSQYGDGMPATCKRYVCNYLADPRPLSITDRPDHVGVIIRRAEHSDRPAPMNRVTYINECVDGGIENALRSSTWRQAIEEDLLSGVPILISLYGDSVAQDIVNVRFHEGSLCCALSACDQHGNPVMTEVQPVYDTSIRIALVPAELGFPFDAQALFHRLGDRDFTIVESFDQRMSEAGIRFRFSRRQAGVIELLQSMLPAGVGRQCGECQACCVATTINDPQLQLPTGVPCPNLCSEGCSIHGDTMPAMCKGYYCGYMLEPGLLPVSARPDKAGAIVRLAADKRQPPPMDKAVWINECVVGGVSNLVANPVWSNVIRRALRTGVPLLISRFDDPQAREAIMVRMVDGKLFCGLTSCYEDGSAILKTLQPVYQQPLQVALIIPEQGFPFDARVLIDHLGGREEVVLGSSSRSKLNTGLHFVFTRWQAELLESLEKLACGDVADPTRIDGNGIQCNVENERVVGIGAR